MMERFAAVDLIELTAVQMSEDKQQVLDINRHQLYEEGIGKDGVSLPPYTTAYAKKKQRIRGKSIVDIYLSGTLQKDMDIEILGQEYTIFSRAPYSQYVAQLRPTIYGLTEDGKQSAWHILRPGIVQQIRNITQTI